MVGVLGYRLPDAAEQLRGRELQRSGEADDRGEPRITSGALQQADLGPVEVAGVPEGFLREATPESLAA